MCKQYQYLALCNNSECETVLGRKHRNRYCRCALDARRLGCCRLGLETADEFRYRDAAWCMVCRRSNSLSVKVESRNNVNDTCDTQSLKLTAPKPEPKPKTKTNKKASKRAETVIDSTFKPALKAATQDFKLEQKRKRKQCHPVYENDDEAEFLEVVSPVRSTSSFDGDELKFLKVASPARNLNYYGFGNAVEDIDSGYGGTSSGGSSTISNSVNSAEA